MSRTREWQRETEIKLGVEWAQTHFVMPGRPQPHPYGNDQHDQAAAHTWKRLSGHWPSWATEIHRQPMTEVSP